MVAADFDVDHNMDVVKVKVVEPTFEQPKIAPTPTHTAIIILPDGRTKWHSIFGVQWGTSDIDLFLSEDRKHFIAYERRHYSSIEIRPIKKEEGLR